VKTNILKYNIYLFIYLFICLCIIIYFARSVARDIGGSDPERMAPPNVEQYIHDVFGNTDIKVEVISDPKVLSQEYPLFTAVDRAARSEYCLELELMFHT
jgi:leucyl aminopeptidase